jgi:PhnB protein
MAVEPTVARTAGISYLRVPAADPRTTAEFYAAVFGWTVDADRPEPSFADGTGHVIGHIVPAAGEGPREAGIRPDGFVGDGLAAAVTGIEPELWVDRPATAVAFYEQAFGATTLHRVGAGEDIVAQLAVGDARFWVAATGEGRFSPNAIGGATGRTLLVVAEPEAVVRRAVAAGARELSPVQDEHGWRLGRIADPHGHEWEIGHPLGAWPLHS